jgi:acyl carrier protein
MHFETVQNIIAENLDIEKEKIQLNSRFKEDLDMDSIELMEVVMACEEEFGVEFPIENADSIATVQDAVNLVKDIKK